MNINPPIVMRVGLAKADMVFAVNKGEDQEAVLSSLRKQLEGKFGVSVCFFSHHKWPRMTVGLSMVGENPEDLIEELDTVLEWLKENEFCSIVESSSQIVEF